MTRSAKYVTVDVFTNQRFGGNPLAVFTDARDLTDREMQSLAAEMNYSETTFVLPPADPSNTARVRIFNRTAEMPFAGHPNVGTGCVLAAMGRASADVLRFEEIAGLVEVRIARDARGAIAGAHIAAPQPLTTGPDLPVDAVAACAGLDASAVVLRAHPPRVASVGLPFCFVEVTAEALPRAAPDLGAFRRLAASFDEPPDRLSLHLYARAEGASSNRLRARMFAPLSGTIEDPATGSANAALAAFLLSLGRESETQFEIAQGVEIGRPSLLLASARRAADGIRATVGGGCVSVLRGEALLD
jgi:trans-2,3-dihydro-3-hydroxyanthranilate isomerase